MSSSAVISRCAFLGHACVPVVASGSRSAVRADASGTSSVCKGRFDLGG